jgi:hypothetical protein
VGRCGREYCSASWLPELRPVNLGVAKDQRLSLNPSQISGACGRLMCCLRYEHDFYVQQRKRFPKENRIIVTARGEEKVVANDIFRERVTLRNGEGETRVLALGDLRRELGTTGGSAVLDTGEEDAASATAAAEVMDEELLRLQDTSERPAFRFPWEQAEQTSAGERGRALPIASHDADAAGQGPGSDAETEQSPNAAGEAGAQMRRARRRRGRRGGRRHPREDRGGAPNGHDPANGGGAGGGAPPA